MDPTTAAKVLFAKCWSKHLGHRGGQGAAAPVPRGPQDKELVVPFGCEWVSQPGVEIGMVLREGWG